MRIASGWLTAFAEALHGHAADIVTGPVRPRFEGPVPPWCCERLLTSVTSSYSLRGDSIRELTGGERHEIPGCNFAVRTGMGRKVGGFDTGFGRTEYGMLAGEDFEFALRVAKSGGTALYVPGCSILHLVNNAKLSREGLRARWRGLGATDKRIREMHSSTRRLPLIQARLRVWRYLLRSGLLGLSGSPAAFRWRLEAERLERSI
jgi:GT2 family glycosyltransferase